MLLRSCSAFVPATLFWRMSASAPVRSAAQTSLSRVFVLAGPTGVGKSAAALSLAERVNGEIISADSVQVFRGLDVGSNKSTPLERGRVPHHLLDIVDPATDDFSAGEFFRAARAATEDVLRRGRIPIVVGGTMMYLRWFVRGRPATPRASDAVRNRVDALVSAADGNWEAGLSLLRERDPHRADELSRNDWYRLQRALQIAETGGQPMSALPQIGASPKCRNEPSKVDIPYDFRCVFLYDERVPLNRRIDRRCEDMILPIEMKAIPIGDVIFEQRSVLSEVGRLLLSRRLRVAGSAPSRAIGYRQAIKYLASRALADYEVNDNGAIGIDAATKAFRVFVEEFQQATRNYAKQQMAWFRKEPFFRWVRAGEGAATVMHSLLQLSSDDFQMLDEVTKDAQLSVREDMMAQGKLMRTYIPSKEVLINESKAEALAVALGEQIAEIIGARIPRGELVQILDAVRK